MSGERPWRVSLKDRAAAPKMKPIRPTPMPHQTASGNRSPNDRPIGPCRPSSPEGRLGQGMRDVTPRSRRENRMTPIAIRTTATTAPGISEAQSYSPPSGWWWTVHPNQVTLASGANNGTAAW